MALFAISDLHDDAGKKPMGQFGESWCDAKAKLADRWQSRVQTGDVVLLPGDVSWAGTYDEVQPFLRYLDRELPGVKLISRGNHDLWWGHQASEDEKGVVKRRGIPPQRMERDYRTIRFVSGLRFFEGLRLAVYAATGGNLPTREGRSIANHLKELGALWRAVERLAGRDALVLRVAMMHYPPLSREGATGYQEAFRTGGFRHVVYGHLEAEAARQAVEGTRDGVQYHFVAAEPNDFAPRLIEPEFRI